MNTKNNKLIESGKEEYEKTNEYSSKADLVKREVEKKYRPIINAERNIFKKVFFWFSMQMQIRRELGKVSSHKNLHLVKV